MDSEARRGSTASADDCDICKEFLDWMLNPRPEDHSGDDNDSSHALTIGMLPSVRSSECHLARFLGTLYDHAKTRKSSDVVDEAKVLVQIGSQTQSPIFAEGRRRNWSISVLYYTTDTLNGNLEYDPVLRLHVDDAPPGPYRDTLLNLGRSVDRDRYDAALVRSWLEECTANPRRSLRPSVQRALSGRGRLIPLTPKSTTAALPATMRLIDLVARTIVSAPKGAAYAALSYVWGATGSLTLTATTAPTLLDCPGGLDVLHVPRTIADAMHVAADLELRYLWVDGICILQDDAADIASQVQAMDAVYSCAEVTIVAAGPESHADAGLVGVSVPRVASQPCVTVGGLRFIAGAPGRVDARKDTDVPTWAQRAWTFQEQALSRRLVYFTPYQVVWYCERGVTAEDYVGELLLPPPLPSSIDDDRRQHNVEGEDRPQRPWLRKELEDLDDRLYEPEKDITYYPRFLMLYLVREMTMESDVLNAIGGVLARYGDGVGEGFLCGLPASMLLEVGLCWMPLSKPLRRRGPTPAGGLFPSWSWCGWIGDVFWETWEEAPDKVLDMSIISEWHVEHPGSSQVLRSRNLHFPRAPGKLEHSEADGKCQNAVLKEIQSAVLCFRAMVARFRVDTMAPWTQITGSDDYYFEWSGIYRVYDDSDTWVGSVHIERALVDGSESLRTAAVHTFVAVSKSGGEVRPWMVNGREQGNFEFLPCFDESLYTGDGYYSYNVLLVDTVGSNFVRRGVGQISMESWDVSGYRDMEVRLA